MSTATPALAGGPSAAVRRVAVIGAGTMGNGIAQAFATSGFEVELVDVDPDLVARALGTIGRSLERVARKQEWPAERAPEVLRRIRGGASLDATRDCPIAIEAVSEDFALKKKVFEQLDATAPPSAILASNTSSISITEIAAVTRRAERVIGMHFMNPVPLMKLVEVVRGLPTSQETFETTVALAEKVGKTTIAARDIPGFIVNRVLIPLLNEACYALYEGLGTVEDIDTGARLGLNHPMGPLELADLIGLDTCLAIANVLHDELGDDKYRPC
ncbi:MAG TPA: 3-hydroxyacyl-CoA dehydrogenase NAD-binding domain-containing protein, partial [Candidatus Eisenbacteria bacterium]